MIAIYSFEEKRKADSPEGNDRKKGKGKGKNKGKGKGKNKGKGNSRCFVVLLLSGCLACQS